MGFTSLVIQTAPHEPGPLSLEGVLDGDAIDLEDQNVAVSGPIDYQLEVQLVDNELIVSGALTLSLELLCSKCGEKFSTTIADSSFLRTFPLHQEAEAVDITPDIREALLLQIPNFPLCRPACKGLCPICKANLNETKCTCVSQQPDDRWDSLDDLKI